MKVSGVAALLVFGLTPALAEDASSPPDSSQLIDIFGEIETIGRVEAILTNGLPDQTTEVDRLLAQILLLEGLLLAQSDDLALKQQMAAALITLDPDGERSIRIGALEDVFAEQENNALSTVDEQAAAEALPEFMAGFVNLDGQGMVAFVLSFDGPDRISAEARSQMEALLVGYVSPLPASNALENRDGYLALSMIAPENNEYKIKYEQYSVRYEDQRSSIIRRMNTEVDEFSNVTFYLHPNKPRYEDSRTYIQTYAGTQPDGQVFLRFRLNYTNDSWIFVESVQFRIDGELTNLPAGLEWFRDNDSEIWEWVDVILSPQLRTLAERIASSDETIMRFNGQQYYDNVTVTQSDKDAIREMFLVEEVLLEMQN